MAEQHPIDRLQDQILDRMARLIERTRILELNRSDAALLERGGEIFYVLDTNTIQSFLQPFERPGWIRLFHNSKLWPSSAIETEANYEELCRVVASQATLLATEFLLGPYPSESRKHIFMSVGHLGELESQANHLLDHVDKLERTKSRVDMEKTMKAIMEIAKISSIDLDEATALIDSDPLFITPIKDRKGRPSRAEAERIRDDYVKSSVCRVLAQDNVVEPLEQITRLSQEFLGTKIRPLEWSFEADADDLKHIDRQTESWRTELTKELARFRHLKPADRSARRKTLLTDARALAFVSWVARDCLAPNQRIVFVTGSRLVIDAYRRWFADSQDATSFLVRPFAQFGPQYNLSDAGARIEDARDTFERTREAVEGTTFPIVIELLQHYRPKVGSPSYHASAKARDLFCLDVGDRKVPPNLSQSLINRALFEHPAVLQQRKDQLETLAGQLRVVERMTLSMLPKLIEERARKAIERSSELAAALAECQGTEADNVARRWLEERFDLAMESAYMFALPIAAELIRGWAPPAERVQRTPATLRLLFPLRGQPLSAEEWLAHTTDDRLAALEGLRDGSPAMVFALASWLTYRSKLWDDAVRFADLAARSASRASLSRSVSFVDPDGIQIDPDAVRRECLYLKALALRMRMASTPPSKLNENDLWREDLERAEAALEISGETSDGHRGTRFLRARSERAAVRLTYCAWAAAGKLTEMEAYRRDPPDIVGILAGAVEDLFTVALELPAVRDQVGALEVGSRSRLDVLHWVSLQTAANQECARLIGEMLLTVKGGASFDPFPDGQIHQIIQAYRLSAMRRAARDVSSKQEIEQQIDALELGGNQLSLDRLMLKAIKKRWHHPQVE